MREIKLKTKKKNNKNNNKSIAEYFPNLAKDTNLQILHTEQSPNAKDTSWLPFWKLKRKKKLKAVWEKWMHYLKREINSSTIIVGDLKVLERISKKDMEDFNCTINERGLIDIYWTLQTQQNTQFYLRTSGTFHQDRFYSGS